MINPNDIPPDEDTHYCRGASTGTNYSAYIPLREKYVCNDFIESILSNTLSDSQKIHCISAIALTWDQVALNCFDELLKRAPEYLISKSPLSSWITDKIALFSCKEALNLIKRYQSDPRIKGIKYAAEMIEYNIEKNRDPSKTWGRAIYKSCD